MTRESFDACIHRYCPNCGAAPMELCTLEVIARGGDDMIVTHRKQRHIPCLTRMIGSCVEVDAVVDEALRLTEDAAQ